MVDSTREAFDRWWQDNAPITARKHDVRVAWNAAIEECAAIAERAYGVGCLLAADILALKGEG